MLRADASIKFHHAGDVTVKAGHELGPRTIGDYELVYFPYGSSTRYSAGGVAYELDGPCALLTRPGEPHQYAFDPAQPMRHLFVHFDVCSEALHERYPLLNREKQAVLMLDNHSLVPQMARQLLYYFHTQPQRWRFLAETLLAAVLEELESRSSAEGHPAGETPMPPQIYNAIKYMEENLSGKMEIERVARSVGWSHEHFTRSFQQIIGYPPKEWVTKRRIERAAQLLLQRTDSVKSIAKEIGYTDEYYFHRLFRRATGMTATAYRRKYSDHRFHELELTPPNELTRFYPLNHFFVLDAEASSISESTAAADEVE